MSRRVNLIPMAGAGQRFVDAGFTVPKPLIDVGGQPMIMHAARSLPNCDQWIFVCRAEHVRDSGIDRQLQDLFRPATVLTVDRLTEGQACTCLLARDELQPDDILTIGACDNAMTWPTALYDSAFLASEADFAVWTFRHNPAVLQNPRMYGWVHVDTAQRITGVSVKVPISEQPMDDHAVIGAFTFRRAADFIAACDDMIHADARVKNEFYVDQAINFAIARGLRGVPLEVDRYICWGTPQDLALYDYWRGYFQRAGLGTYVAPAATY